MQVGDAPQGIDESCSSREMHATKVGGGAYGMGTGGMYGMGGMRSPVGAAPAGIEPGSLFIATRI